MEKSNFLKFLILWVSLSQGFAFSSDNRNDYLVRKRRVIDRTPNANTRVQLRDVPYVVNIKRNEIHACAGSILAAQIIITSIYCVSEHAMYTVVSGTISTISGGTSHIVTGILRYPQNIPHLLSTKIALLSIHPPIIFRENINRPIPIFQSTTGQLPANTIVTVSGYGITYQNRRGGIGCSSSGGQLRLTDPHELRSIRLPTISLQACRNLHDHHVFITDEIICTVDQNKSCSPGESGNPLVYNGHLVGILIRDGFDRESDLFVSVASPEARSWIFSHLSPENIPPYMPPPANPPPHYHRDPQACSRVHPCND